MTRLILVLVLFCCELFVLSQADAIAVGQTSHVCQPDDFCFHCAEWDISNERCVKPYMRIPLSALVNSGSCPIASDHTTRRPIAKHVNDAATCATLCYAATGDTTCLGLSAGPSASFTNWNWYPSNTNCETSNLKHKRQYTTPGYGNVWWALQEGKSQNLAFANVKCNWNPVGGINGDPTFRTLDGLSFDYTGLCPVVAAQDCESDSFKVVAHNTPCGLKSCLEALEVRLGSAKKTLIRFGLGPKVWVNNVEVDGTQTFNKTFSIEGGSITSMTLPKEVGGSDTLIRLRSDFGLHVDWSGFHWGYTSIKVANKNIEKTCGLIASTKDGDKRSLRLRGGQRLPIQPSRINEQNHLTDEHIVERFVSDWIEHQVSGEKNCWEHASKVSQQNCGDGMNDKREKVRGICRRLVVMGGVDTECTQNKVDLSQKQLVDKCEQLSCGCLRMEQHFLECVQWAIRDLQTECGFEMDQALESDGVAEARAM